ncbi:MAG: hypothetical protein ABJG78_15885 [Cyclobacteriaceae bacterium]
MTATEIQSLVQSLSKEEKAELIETHISWIILTSEFAYKFKKPMRYSFLNYSKPMKRKFYCQQELELNSRYSNIYLDVVIVYRNGDSVQLAKGDEVIDFGVKMLRMNPEFQMDRMIEKDLVTTKHVAKLARKIAGFHQKAEVVKTPFCPREASFKFEDIRTVKSFLYRELGLKADRQINEAILESKHFINSHVHLFENRIKYGFVRDLHGDLHSKNIFLYKDPIVFDCIEFNDDFRQIDVLNEIAFTCMDLEAFGREDLNAQFIATYLEAFPVMSSHEEEQLFSYYKCYRANVRAKVNALRAKQASNEKEKHRLLEEVTKYLNLMTAYKDQFGGSYSLEAIDFGNGNNHSYI